MRNFGTGMWRRIGDYERIQVPQLIQQAKIQQYLAYRDYLARKELQTKLDAFHKEMEKKQISH
jgi:hypothetical protein